MDSQLKEIDQFITAWPDSSAQTREPFIRLKTKLQDLKDAHLQFVARPGVTYSLRGIHQRQGDRPLFVMVDVIDDEPRWLSICFYGKMVGDPEQRGDYVPGGLLGEDGLCFDIETDNEDDLSYLMARVDEAYSAVSKT